MGHSLQHSADCGLLKSGVLSAMPVDRSDEMKSHEAEVKRLIALQTSLREQHGKVVSRRIAL